MMKGNIRSKILLTICMVFMVVSQILGVSATEKNKMPELETGKNGTLTVTLSCENKQGKTV